MVDQKDEYRPTIRTITAFVTLSDDDFRDATDFELSSFPMLESKIEAVVNGLKLLEKTYQQAGYTVQTLRIATNPFGEWLVSQFSDDCYILQKRLTNLDRLLSHFGIFACAVGPAQNKNELACCRQIVATSDKFSCSYMLDGKDLDGAMEAAKVIYDISSIHSAGLGNFQFCVAAKTCQPWIPFFPIAYQRSREDITSSQRQSLSIPSEEETGISSSDQSHTGSIDTGNDDSAINVTGKDDNANLVVQFAIGLENGSVVRRLLQDCGSLANIDTVFRQGMLKALLPIQHIAKSFSSVSRTSKGPEDTRNALEKIDNEFQEVLLKNILQIYPELVDDFTTDSNKLSNALFRFIGIDTSVNPSLDEDGSIAAALECLEEVNQFGGPGTMAAAAAITSVLQSLEDIRSTGYCGLMLPVCEDQRLAQLSTFTSKDGGSGLGIVHLLNISSVCGVGVDTVPIAGNNINDRTKSLQSLRSLLLDVVGLAERWNKPLTLRAIPCPGKKEGEMSEFDDSPHMVNAKIFSLDD